MRKHFKVSSFKLLFVTYLTLPYLTLYYTAGVVGGVGAAGFFGPAIA